MINVGTLSKLRRMVRRDGLSVREASKKLGIARNTAARWLTMDEMVEPKYPKRVTVESILDPYKEQLINWLKTDSHRGKRDRRTTKALFEAVRALGYSGSRGPVYEFCKHWRDEQFHKPSLRAYPAHLLVVAADGECVTLKRSFERDQTIYDWTHYISLIERKPPEGHPNSPSDGHLKLPHLS